MIKTNMLEALNLADDEIIENALNIDSPEKFKEITMNTKAHNKNKIIKILSGLAACICLVVAAITAFNSSAPKTELVKIPAPITQVSSADEMKSYLGYDVPVIKDKSVDAYIVIGDDDSDYANHARIMYSDGSSFEMEKQKNTDVSGIYGGTLTETVEINGVEVSIYTYENLYYANWSNGDYSYSFSADSADSVKTQVSILIYAE